MGKMTLAEFADSVTEMMTAITREFLKQQTTEFYKVRVTMPQFVILSVLSRQGESNMTALAHALHVSTAAMTGVVERLVRDGYVVRSSDPKDRRIIKVSMSAKGDKLVSKVNHHRRRMLMNMFGKITQREREDYLKILIHIRDHLK